MNVGGQIKSVYVPDLVSVKGSKLELMFNDPWRHNELKKDKQGYIYLDRDPVIFD